MSFATLFVFAATEFFLTLSPGPAVLTVVSQGVRYGAKASLRGTVGILAGNAIYFFISAIGVGAALAASEFLFTAIKYAGAGYLIVLGGRMVVASFSSSSKQELTTEMGGTKLFAQGLTTQLANPKAIIFFTALLPQFINSEANVAWQCLVLGAVSVGVEFPVLAMYGWLAERGSASLKKHAAWIDRIAGSFLIAAGIRLALARE